MRCAKAYTVRLAGRPGARAFTLIELLVVIAIMGLLVSILVPSVTRAMHIAKRVTCLTRLDAQITAIQMYAGEHDGWLPVGPDGKHLWYDVTYDRMASNQIWIGQYDAGGEVGPVYNAHGALLGGYLSQPRSMFCPDDDSSDWKEELPKIEQRLPEDAYCSYLYRGLDARADNNDAYGRLASLGRNAAGEQVKALVMDINSMLAGAPTRTNHAAEKVNIGFAAGYTDTFSNDEDELTLTGSAWDGAAVLKTLDEVFEHADHLGQ